MPTAPFPHLFSSIQIGTMTAKNRLLMSAMSINFGVDADGRVTDQLTAYFKARAQGGVGTMLLGGGAVDPSGLELPNLPALWDDACIAPLTTMVEAMRPFDVRFGVQLMHGGRQSYHDAKVAPSPIPAPAVVKGVPRELSTPEVRQMADAFGNAARRCQLAGFDFVEIHGAHGYLINQFLSPNANHRTDRYGGTFENRARFYLEVLESIKSRCGSDFTVGARINAEDYIEGGSTLADAIRLVPMLEAAGADYLHVSAGVYGSRQLTIPSMYVAQGCFVHLAAAVKTVAQVPVVAVGRIKDPRLAEQILAEGKADMVAMGRSLLADPDLPVKARENRLGQIRPCIGCCLGCIHAVLQLEPGGCVVNPDVGREYQVTNITRHPAPKKVVVVGAGPAGLAAARMAKLCGHDPVVFDSRQKPGGILQLAGKAPGRSDLQEIIDFYVRELERLAVPIHLGMDLDEKQLAAETPQAVFVASGSLPKMPLIKGLFQSPLALWTAVEVLEGQTVDGKILVLGGGQAGLITADFLAARGRTVAVLNRRSHFAEEMSANDRYYLRERLNAQNVALYKEVAIEKFTRDGAHIRHARGRAQLSGFQTMVIAEGGEPVRDTINFIKKQDVAMQVIGDAKSARHLMFAISEGEEAGRAL